MSASASSNPCLNCGACCASFRVDFACEELQSRGGAVPDGLAVELSAHTARLRGTDHAQPRCAALVGRVGVQASCGIHEWRPPAASSARWRRWAAATTPATAPAPATAWRHWPEQALPHGRARARRPKVMCHTSLRRDA
jgi:uncharacterized protein